MFNSNEELYEWGKSIGLSEQALLLVKKIRESEPSRRVRSGPYNVGGRFNRSNKMSHTIQHESRTVEFPALLMMELDELYSEEDVIEVWDQPLSFVVNYPGKNGRNLGHIYTADFFVIRRKSAGWEEWKLEEKLLKLSKQNPEKYFKDEEGIWHFPPGERYANPYGLYFHVHSSSEINWVLYRNLKLLLPCYQNKSLKTDSSTHQNILTLVKSMPGITLAELLEQVGDANNSHVFELLLTKDIFIDLCEAWLGEEHLVRLFSDRETRNFFVRLSLEQRTVSNKSSFPRVTELLPGTTLRWNNIPLEIVMISDSEIMLRKDENDYPVFPIPIFEQFIREGRVIDLQVRPVVDRNSEIYKVVPKIGKSEALVEALRKLNIIKPFLNGEKIIDKSVTDRTHRNWITAYKRAEAKYSNGLLGLMPRHHLKGNTTDRLNQISPRLRSMMEDFIGSNYETPVNKTKSLVYGEFRALCEAEGISPPSLKTFNETIKKRRTPQQIEKIEGSKVAYQEEEFCDWFNGIPLHGDRPWEFAHIDHTRLDVHLIHSEKGTGMGCSWISLLIDSNTRRVLARHLTYDEPSYRSCMCLIRECVRLHGRLPECFIVDGGKEFQSIYFEQLLARYKSDVIWRPATKPRYGAIIERFIHTLNTQFIHNLRGNTKIMKKVRQVTKAVAPETHAVWDLPFLDCHLEKYFYDEYPNQFHSGLGQTPMEAYAEGMARFPIPPPEHIPYDDYFLIDTMPSSRNGTAMLLRSRGIKFRGYYYRSKKIRRPELYGKQLEIRYDPFNIAHIYVWISKEWVECFVPPDIYAKLKNKTEREIKIFTEEQRQLQRVYGRGFNNRVVELARNQAKREASEKLKLQILRDAELRKSAEQQGIRLSPGKSSLSSLPVTQKEKAYVNKLQELTEGASQIPVKKNRVVAFQRAMKSKRRS